MGGEPRLLVLTPDFPPVPGGIQLLVDRIVQNADRLCVRVLAADAPGGRAFDAGRGLDVHRVSFGTWHRPTIAALNAAALTHAARYRPAAVLSAHIVTAPAAALIGAVLRVPFVQYLHAKELGARPALAAFALRRSNAAITVSRYTHGLAVAAGGVPARLHIIPPGVDPPDAADSPVETGDTAVKAARPTVVTVARLGDRYKGHETVMRALPLIRARVPDVEWVVIGDGPLRPALERASADQGLEGAVRFLGAASDVERDRWLRRAHVFTMPSRLPGGRFAGEGFGIVYLEAAARALPVVAGNVGGAVDAVVHDKTGLLVDPTDHVALADAIGSLLLDFERARALGAAGARRAREFTWPAVARRVEDLILEQIRRSRRRAADASALRRL